jgi:hypothetical protein
VPDELAAQSQGQFATHGQFDLCGVKSAIAAVFELTHLVDRQVVTFGQHHQI